MTQLIDISGLIEEGMWVDNPLIPPPSIKELSTISGENRWEAHSIQITTLTGTYLEGSAHILQNGTRIANVNPSQLIQPVSIIQLEAVKPGEGITAKRMEAIGVRPDIGGAILIGTGWDSKWNSPDYVRLSPHLTLDAIDWLMQYKPTILGGDFPSFDSAQTKGTVVRKVLLSGALILAPVVALKQANRSKMVLIALPLKVKDVCGSPCRAILLDFEELMGLMIKNVSN
jgi:arylformamidase